MGMDTDQTPAARILSEGRARRFSRNTRFGDPNGFGARVRFTWFVEEGVADDDIRFLAFKSYNSDPDRQWPFEGKYSDLQSQLDEDIRTCGERLHAVVTSGPLDGESVGIMRHMHRTLDVPWVKTTDGKPLPRCEIYWTCREDGDRSKDSYSVDLQPAVDEDYLAPSWSGTGETVISKKMPGWMVQLVETCRRDLLAWEPGQG